MADTQSILQLGIEAARAGDKDEARNLFRLLTRETPNDPQSWLWLAGVAEDREEKRAALEAVTRLDPSNELARQGLAALGGPSAAPPPAAPAPAADDFSFDLEPDPVPAPEPARPAARDSGRTRELTPDEEFAMSLDSLGSLSTQYNDRASGSSGSSGSSGGNLDFDIPDFGEDLDLDAYMNRERVDASQIEIVPEAPKPKPGKKKPKMPAATDASGNPVKASGGNRMPIYIGLGALLLAVAVIIFWPRNTPPENPNGIAGATPTIINPPSGGGDGTAGPTDLTTIPVDPNAQPTVDPNAPPVDPNAQPTTDPNAPPVDPNQQPTAAPPPGQEVGTRDPALAGAQPQILQANGYNPIDVNGWFFNYGGVSGVVNGPIGNVTPGGRWLVVVPLAFNGTGQDQPFPADLVVVKDAQGRVYRPNADASEAYFNANPGQYNVHQKQNQPQGFNYVLPLL
ncbi:MAG TPA: hypothetical protein VGE07_18815, partial [Herpetosiphonaceae bacterium]